VGSQRITASAMARPRSERKMWKPRRLTSLWASYSCYRNSFNFYLPRSYIFIKSHSLCPSTILISVSVPLVCVFFFLASSFKLYLEKKAIYECRQYAEFSTII
jgi:hypothetical protein